MVELHVFAVGCFTRDQQPLSKKGQKQQKAEEKAKRKAETQARLVRKLNSSFKEVKASLTIRAFIVYCKCY